MLDREKKQSIMLSIVIISLFSSCHYYINHQGLQFTILGSEIQKTLSSVKPSVFQYQNTVAMRIDHPEVFLINNAKTLIVIMDLAINLSSGDTIVKKIKGTFKLEGNISYSGSQKSLYLSKVRINEITISNIPQENLNQFVYFLQEPLTNYYNNNPIYVFNQPQSQSIPANYILKRTEINNHQLNITLGM